MRLIRGGSYAGVFYMFTETQRHRVLFRTQNLQNYLTKDEGRKTKNEKRRTKNDDDNDDDDDDNYLTEHILRLLSANLFAFSSFNRNFMLTLSTSIGSQ